MICCGRSHYCFHALYGCAYVLVKITLDKIASQVGYFSTLRECFFFFKSKNKYLSWITLEMRATLKID